MEKTETAKYKVEKKAIIRDEIRVKKKADELWEPFKVTEYVGVSR